MIIETKPILFLDFDGTISCRDAIDAILEKFADKSWQIVEEKWKSGAIGSRACLSEQVALISATTAEIDALLGEMKLDAGFEKLLKICRRFQVKSHIISDGFDYCIKRILSNSAAGRNLPVCSSHLEYRNGAWQTDFPYFPEGCKHGCATCKPQVMKNLNRENAPMIFVGDGLSDRYAAQTADLVFAKKGLAKFCAERKIKFSAYENLFDVAQRLEKLLSAHSLLPIPATPFPDFVAAQEVFN
ncbi:MAG: MtnX-like HAD-IB family phosphatase [Pyrinomonadaceae bacterium]